jgi:hypothetical protein
VLVWRRRRQPTSRRGAVMILGMPALLFTHVAISLIGIVSGFIVVFGMFANNRMDAWTAIFLVSTVLTSVTGYIFFPFEKITPGIIVGVISLLFLAVAIGSRYVKRMAGGWSHAYIITAILSFYLNFFVLIVQSFEKVPALRAAAPTQKEPPFLIAQVAAMLLFIVFGFVAVKKFHPAVQ